MRAEGGYEREPRRPRRRRFAGAGSRETRRAMKEFIRSRQGVEAYVEPPTLHHPMSVALVASDGEWMRFELPDDRYLRKLSQKLRLPLYDAARVGYPKRMKDYRRGEESE